MKRKFISSLIAITCILNAVSLCAEVKQPKVCAKGAVLMEQQSGRILYEKSANDPLAMASTTKIMTCILALEKGDINDIVVVSKRASSAPPVKLHLRVGEKQRLGDLLYALMLQSDNDAAVAIAEHIGGSVESFCDEMTLKAKEIGAENTVFKTPNGLDAPGHGSTARDMAIIASYALNNPEFIRIVTTPDVEIPTTPTDGSRTYGIQNKNRFFYSYSGANGMKTGFTNKAGHCFVGSAIRDDMQLIGVALASGWGAKGKNQKYTDVINMMNYGFDNYKKYEVVTPSSDVGTIKIDKGTKENTNVACEKEVVLPLTKDEKENIYNKYVYKQEMIAPVYKGSEVGKVQVICNGKVLKEEPIVIGEDVPKATIVYRIKKFLNMD